MSAHLQSNRNRWITSIFLHLTFEGHHCEQRLQKFLMSMAISILQLKYLKLVNKPSLILPHTVDGSIQGQQDTSYWNHVSLTDISSLLYLIWRIGKISLRYCTLILLSNLLNNRNLTQILYFRAQPRNFFSLHYKLLVDIHEEIMRDYQIIEGILSIYLPL